jgi:hypothetical protein
MYGYKKGLMILIVDDNIRLWIIQDFIKFNHGAVSIGRLWKSYR